MVFTTVLHQAGSMPGDNGRAGFAFREIYSDDEAFEAGEREGRRYIAEGHDARPRLWPISTKRRSDFADGFHHGAACQELDRRGLPFNGQTMGALWDEWDDEAKAEVQRQERQHAGASTALWHVKNEFDPLAVFSGPPSPTNPKVLDLCAGPGGWEEGARLLGIHEAIYGIDMDRDACNTARARGYRRYQGDITAFDPAQFTAATGLIISTPCPTFSIGGKSTDGHEGDVQAVLDAITGLGSDPQYYTDPAELRRQVSDPRTALAYEVARYGLLMPNIKWMVAENVPGIDHIFDELSAEMSDFGWADFDKVRINAETLGAASKRDRSFFIAKRRVTNVGFVDELGLGKEGTPMRDALGWPEGHRLKTRGERKVSGGSEFSADQVAWCLTEKARSWYRVADGRRLSAAEAGLLNGFPLDYPWQGSRSKQFHQVADVVNPLVGAAVLGDAMGIPWREAVLQRVEQLYGQEASQMIRLEAPTIDPLRPHSGRSNSRHTGYEDAGATLF